MPKVIGININDQKINLVYTKDSTITNFESFDLPENLVRNYEILSYDALADFIRNSMKEKNLKKGKVSVILPESIVYGKNLSLPLMSIKQLSFNLPYEFKDYLTLDKEQYFYDYAVKNIDEEAKTMDLYAVCTAKENINKYKLMFKRANLNLTNGVNAAYGLGRVIKNKGLKGDICFVKLGVSETNITIFKDEWYQSIHTIQRGLIDIERIIANELSVDEHIAHAYRISNYENCLSLEKVVDFYNALAIEILRAVNFYNYNNANANLNNLYLIGEGALNEKYVSSIKEFTNLNILDAKDLLQIEEASLYLEAYAAALSASKEDK